MRRVFTRYFIAVYIAVLARMCAKLTSQVRMRSKRKIMTFGTPNDCRVPFRSNAIHGFISAEKLS